MTKQDFPEPLNTKPIDSLNQKITIEEIKKSIKYLKTKKAPGLDQRNDKMFCRNMIEHLQTLFNNIMESGYYPTSWNRGLICSIYKSGILLSYNNYISTPFSTSIGLKQGDILSTMFFNLFINDLSALLEKHHTQSEESDSPELFNTR